MLLSFSDLSWFTVQWQQPLCFSHTHTHLEQSLPLFCPLRARVFCPTLKHYCGHTYTFYDWRLGVEMAGRLLFFELNCVVFFVMAVSTSLTVSGPSLPAFFFLLL